jgi:hypothetical protein
VDLHNPTLDRDWRPVLLALIAVVIFSRAPNLILDPRFWFYEATTYLAYARQNGVLASLFFVSTREPSYLNLSANIPALLAAKMVPLKAAPAITTGWAFVIQMVPFALVLFGRSWIWVSHRQKLVVCLLLLFGPPVLNAEVWLNSGNSQVFCGLIGLLLLCEDTRDLAAGRKWLYFLLLVFCTLSGPYTVFLAPAFVLKSTMERSPESKRQAWVVVGGVVVQAALHLWTRFAFPFSPSRLADNLWSERLVSLFVGDVIYAFFGYDLTPILTNTLGLGPVFEGEPVSFWSTRIAGLMCALALLVVVWFVAGRARRRIDLLPSLSFVLVLFALFIIVPDASNRYVVVPGTTLLLAVFTVAVRGEKNWRRSGATFLLSAAIATGVAAFWRDLPREYSPLGRAVGRPIWSQEVQRWQDDPDYRMRIWPYVGPEIQLAPMLPIGGPVPPSVYLDVLPFSLIAKGGRVERVVPVDGLPADFRLLIKLRSSQPSDVTRLALVFENGFGEQLNRQPIRGFVWHQDYWVNRWSSLIPLRYGTDFSDVRRIRVVLRSSATMPHRVKFERFSIGPANVGAFERWIPGRRVEREVYRFEGSPKASTDREGVVPEDQ